MKYVFADRPKKNENENDNDKEDISLEELDSILNGRPASESINHLNEEIYGYSD